MTYATRWHQFETFLTFMWLKNTWWADLPQGRTRPGLPYTRQTARHVWWFFLKHYPVTFKFQMSEIRFFRGFLKIKEMHPAMWRGTLSKFDTIWNVKLKKRLGFKNTVYEPTIILTIVMQSFSMAFVIHSSTNDFLSTQRAQYGRHRDNIYDTGCFVSK